jgi:hypothetical protein
MAFQHQMQSSRYELKYLVTEYQATAIRDFSRPSLEPDPYYVPGTQGYPVHSLYLDTADLVLYHQTMQGLKNRFKLRIRFYDDDPDSPAFLEIKRRTTNVIGKQRAGMTKKGVNQLLSGAWPNPSELRKRDEKSLIAMETFCKYRDQIAAVGSHYVSYLREAYVAPSSDHVRVTFDRQLRGGYYEQGEPLRVPRRQNDVNPGGEVILELKFTDRFPGWMGDLVRVFNLQRLSVPKYCDCVDRAGLQGSSTVFGFQEGLH